MRRMLSLVGEFIYTALMMILVIKLIICIVFSSLTIKVCQDGRIVSSETYRIADIFINDSKDSDFSCNNPDVYERLNSKTRRHVEGFQ